MLRTNVCGKKKKKAEGGRSDFKQNSKLTWQELYFGLLMPSLRAASTSKMVSGFEGEIRSLMALSPGREAITHSNESTIVGNGLMKET